MHHISLMKRHICVDGCGFRLSTERRARRLNHISLSYHRFIMSSVSLRVKPALCLCQHSRMSQARSKYRQSLHGFTAHSFSRQRTTAVFVVSAIAMSTVTVWIEVTNSILRPKNADADRHIFKQRFLFLHNLSCERSNKMFQCIRKPSCSSQCSNKILRYSHNFSCSDVSSCGSSLAPCSVSQRYRATDRPMPACSPSASSSRS